MGDGSPAHVWVYEMNRTDLKALQNVYDSGLDFTKSKTDDVVTKDRKSQSAPVLMGELPASAQTAVRNLIAKAGADLGLAEAFQVVLYDGEGFYEKHHDATHLDPVTLKLLPPDEDNLRMLTILVYLKGNCKGGNTAFLNTSSVGKAHPQGGTVYGPRAEGEESLAIPPKEGTVVIFHNLDDEGQPLEATIHEAQEVTEGTKVVFQIWLRQKQEFVLVPDSSGSSSDSSTSEDDKKGKKARTIKGMKRGFKKRGPRTQERRALVASSSSEEAWTPDEDKNRKRQERRKERWRQSYKKKI